MTLTKRKANLIYSVLVNIAGAPENQRNTFIYHHTLDAPSEWRFQGSLGFGGKYRISRNMVDCYPEDETSERAEIIKQVNIKLSLI